MLMNKMNKIIILQHPSGLAHNAYDVLVHKEHKDLVNFDDGYKMECQYVEKFLKTNKDYVYVFSEDNGHIPSFNWIVNYVNEEVSKGAKLVILDANYPKDNKAVRN